MCAHPNIVLLLQQQLSKSSWPGEDHNILHTSTKSEVFARSSASTAEVSALQKPPANLSSRLLTWLDPHIDQSFDVLRGEKLCLRIDCGWFNVYFFEEQSSLMRKKIILTSVGICRIYYFTGSFLVLE